MTKYLTPQKVKFFTAVTFQNEEQLKDVENYLTKKICPIESRSEIFDFTFTDYYEKEMGKNLKKVFLSFERPDNREKLPFYKKTANDFEDKTSIDGKRTVNIDPGYLGEASLILASTKNFNHRIYLGDGVFGDCNMLFENGEFVALPWTYPDYKDDLTRNYFKNLRETYIQQLKQSEKESITYKDAGVDIGEGDRAIKNIKKMVKETFGENVLTELGKFGGFYELDKDQYNEPVIVSSVDGVGTKLKVAFAADVHNTVGQDLVNHCVNDILCCGAKPMFFLDYLAFGKLDVNVFEGIVAGFAKACKETGSALIGGETAEMPGVYTEGEYDISGTIVGIAEKSKIIDGRNIKKGDLILGLPSTGLHTNGYSLARKILFEKAGYKVDSYVDELQCTVGEELLKIHRCYLNEIFPFIENDNLHGLAHITGGGLTGNISRLLDNTMNLAIDWNAWEWPPAYKLMQDIGNVPDDEMHHVFNLGIGITMITDRNNADIIKDSLNNQNMQVIQVGEIK